ncbi:MAG: 2'-deoxycytidine 5'-triphosphate deaminase domain-containing protein [Maricaulaceae bacterium]
MNGAILPDSAVDALIQTGSVNATGGVAPDQIQPASLDLRLGETAYRLRASFLPSARASVQDRLDDLALHQVDLRQGAVLEPGAVYLAPLAERLALPTDLSGRANPKSSTGRIDVFARVLAEAAGAFDTVPAGYSGPLYLEIAPRTFAIVARAGARLAQLRFQQGQAEGARAVDVAIDLEGRPGQPIGYRAKRHAPLIDLARVGGHDPREYWEPLYPRATGLVLDPDEFYILASDQPVRVDLDEAAEMAPIAPEIGEFRAHYAGFFDPGFGCDPGGGARAVLEVRGRDVPFVLEHGQTVARLVYDRLTEPPRRPYGGAGSHYQAQGLKLSKHFAAFD